MNKKMSKRQRDIKTKLMAAICMLLVSSIMMVSTTYAWFTLSTAPEVTGINTAVGANGNLEMALLPVDGGHKGETLDFGITSGTTDSMDATKDATISNVTWGNLVDLSDEDYGLQNITLYPAALNYAGENTTVDADNPASINTAGGFLKTPTYGSDGRVSAINANTMTGVYDEDSFVQITSTTDVATVDAPTGVRVIGTVSGMSDRQLAFREALAAASNVRTDAQGVARKALRDEGSTLASVAIKKAMEEGATFTRDEVESLQRMVTALVGTADTEGALSLIEGAIRQYIYAYQINQKENYADTKVDILGDDTTAPKALADLASYTPDSMNEMIAALSTTAGKTADAQGKLTTLLADSHDDTYEWEELSPVINLLANADNMWVNGIPAKDLKSPTADPDDAEDRTGIDVLVDAALGGDGIVLTVAPDSGVFADIADFCGDYTATIRPVISYGGIINNKEIPATMVTATEEDPPYLAAAEQYLRNLPAIDGADTDTAPISDYYGYIIDLAFRTNAADSYLKLQTKGIDRVYSDNTQNDATMGGGSTMTFESKDEKFSNVQVIELMKNIKVVFFDPADNTILAYGKLVEGSDVTEGDAVTMELSLTSDKEGLVDIEDAKIMNLEQNKAHRVSVLVYLDGETVTNADVAFGSAMSMQGKLNLQFASSAELKPMEYEDLRTGTGTDGNNAPATPDVTRTEITTGVTVTGDSYSASNVYFVASSEGNAITAVISDADGAVTEGVTVTINGETATYANGVWAAATDAEEAPDTVAIVVTASGT